MWVRWHLHQPPRPHPLHPPEPSATKPIPMVLSPLAGQRIWRPRLARLDTTPWLLRWPWGNAQPGLAAAIFTHEKRACAYPHARTQRLQTASPRPPNIPHQQASALNVVPSLLECREVYPDIIVGHLDNV